MIFAGAYLAHIQDVRTECRRKKLSDTERETDRQTDRQIDRQRDRERERDRQ